MEVLRFDYCVSNPPYQESFSRAEKTGVNNIAVNIFQHFYQFSLWHSKHTAMIFPGGRWMQRQSKSSSITEIILPTVVSVEWFPNGKEQSDVAPFPGAMINDGVAIVCGSVSAVNEGSLLLNGVQVPRPERDEILPLENKFLEYMYDIVSHRRIIQRREAVNVFDLRSYLVERFPSLVQPVTKYNVEPSNGMVRAYLANASTGSAKRVRLMWLREDAVCWSDHRREVFASWKVCIAQGTASKAPELGPYFVVPSECVVGESWLIVGTFCSHIEAEAYKNYLNLPVVRCLLAESKGGNIKTWGYFVPDMMDYTDTNTDLRQLLTQFAVRDSSKNDISAFLDVVFNSQNVQAV